MIDERTIYRNAIKKIFQKYGMQRNISLNHLNDLIDEVNTYYDNKETAHDKAVKELGEIHKEQLKEQLNGWVDHLTKIRNSMNDETDTGKLILEGFDVSLKILKDVAERE